VDIALVIDGPSFQFFDKDNEIHLRKSRAIVNACRSVIACRFTLQQKQQLVSLVKKYSAPRAVTLSVGDGANVCMIREADVSVGIFSKDGPKAATHFDFGIGQFKFLRKLLLVHGRLNYVRLSRWVLFSIHYNIVITLTLLWYK